MGTACCTGGGGHQTGNIKKTQKYLLSQLPLHQKQIEMLHLIYIDLSQRIVDQALNLQNFLLFFHKNGFWGQRLFKQFDYDQSNLITQTEFITGISKIFKTNEDQKISLLFKFFSSSAKKKSDQDQNTNKNIQQNKNGGNQKNGVSFDDFLTMLYNYPKEDLKQILNDKQFFETQLRGSLKIIGQNRRLESVYKMGTFIRQNKKPLQCRFEQKSDNNDAGAPGDIQPSMVGRDIMKKLKFLKNQQTTIKVQDGDTIVELKTNNFHHLVKKFAKRMFMDMKVDIKTGKLSKAQFTSWIIKHNKLYDTYYNGFRNQIWQLDQISSQLKYLKTDFQKKTDARYIQINRIIKIQMILIHSILVLTHEKDISQCIQTICLQGLAVSKTFQKESGFGIQISHRDGIYRKRIIYFKNQETRDQWSEVLKYFKGQTIETLFNLKNKIGTGKFSVVYEGQEKQTGKKYAVKVIQSYKLDSEAKTLIAHQTSIMQIFSHPLLVQFKDSIQTKTHLYIIAQLCQGKDLFEFVKQWGYLQQSDAAVILQQMIVGLRYMHALGIVHRDLKPQNIMVSYDEKNREINKIKIIDFGFANYLQTLAQLPPEENLAGTPNYIAPQILRRQPISFKIDIFALGSILYFALSGNLPFNDFTMTQIFNRTLDGAYNYKDKVWDKVSPEAKDLIDKLLKNNPSQRISLQEAIKHPWFQIAKQKKKDNVSRPRKSYQVIF